MKQTFAIQQLKNLLFASIAFVLLLSNSYAASVTSSTSGLWSSTAWPNTGRTGNISSSTSSKNITGSGTSFTTELSVGNIIKNTSNVVIGTIESISSNTSLTLVNNAASTNSNISYRSQGVGSVDVITIASSHTITVNGTFTCASITFSAPNTSNKINLNDGASLYVTGAMSMTNATSNDRFAALNVNNGTVSVGSLTMNGSTNRRRSEVNIQAGSLDVRGNLTAANAAGCLFTFTEGGTLLFGGTVDQDMTISTTTSSTVVYDATADQTVKPGTYNNLTIAGSGIKTLTTVTVNETFTISGTATMSTIITYGANAGLKFESTTRTTNDTEWPTTFDQLGGVSIGPGAVITLNNAKTFGTSDPLIILSGGTLNTSNQTLSLSGDFQNQGTFNGGSSNVVITGNVNQNIDGFTTTGTVSMTKSGNLATFTGNVNGGPLTINGSGGSLSFGADNTHTFTGQFTRTAGAVFGGSSIINIGGNGSAVTATFTPETSTVRWIGAAQNISGMDYYNIELAGSGTKSLSTLLTTVNNNFKMSGSAATSLTVGLSIAGDLQINGTGNFTAGAFALSIGDSLIIGDGGAANFTLSSSTGAKTFNSIIINAGGAFTNSANMAINVAGHLKNLGTFTSGTNTYTLTGTSKEISGTFSFSNLAISGSYTNLGNLTFTANPTGAGSLTNGASSILTLNYSGGFSFANFNATAVGNTVNYLFAGAQTINPVNYHHLSLGGSGNKSMQTGTTTIGGNFTLLGSASTSAVIGLNIDGDFSLANTATFNSGSFTHSVAGTVSIVNGSTFNFSSGNLTLNGNAQTFVNFNASASTFNNLSLTGGEKTFNSNVVVNNLFTINSDSKFIYGSSTSLQLGGSLSGTGSIRAKSCGNANNTLLLAGTTSMGSLYFEPGFEHLSTITITKTAGSINFDSDIAINGTFTLPNTGSFIANFSQQLNMYGSSVNVTGANGKINLTPSSSLVIGRCSTDGLAITIPNDIFTSAPTIKNLILDRTNGLTFGNQMISVTGVVTLTSGNLATNNNLTLVSNASGTARVAPIPNTVSVTGNVTAERFIPGGNGKRKWRFLSSSVNVSGSIALSQYKDDIFVTAPSAAAGGFDVNPFASNASIRTYTESVSGSLNNGWTNPTNITNTIPTGIGAEVFVRGSRALANPYLNWTIPDNVTIDYIGVLNKGNITPSLSYTNTASGSNDGFNLVGNPYASPINFDTTGWTKTNIENKYWCYNPNTTLWGAYNAASGESTNGMTKYISSGQAFFVRATSASPVLTFTENVKSINAGNNYYRPSSTQGKFPVLKITLTNDSADTDETLVILDPESNYTSNDPSDMLKFYNDALNIYTYASDNSIMGMNAIPLSKNNDTLSLPVWSYDSTSIATTHHVLNFSRFESIDTSINIYLIDNYLETTRDVKKASEYHFMITNDVTSYGNNRFEIVFEKTSTGLVRTKPAPKEFVLYPNPASEQLYIQVLADKNNLEENTFQIIDLLGNIIETGTLNFENNLSSLQISALHPGNYFLRIITNGQTSVKKFIKK